MRLSHFPAPASGRFNVSLPHLVTCSTSMVPLIFVWVCQRLTACLFVCLFIVWSLHVCGHYIQQSSGVGRVWAMQVGCGMDGVSTLLPGWQGTTL